LFPEIEVKSFNQLFSVSFLTKKKISTKIMMGTTTVATATTTTTYKEDDFLSLHWIEHQTKGR
jgi:hypothetical protein